MNLERTKNRVNFRLKASSQTRSLITTSAQPTAIIHQNFPNQFYVTQEQINGPNRNNTAVTAPSRAAVEPSAPSEEQVLIPTATTNTPTIELDYDKPPAYDDLVRNGEVSAIVKRDK